MRNKYFLADADDPGIEAALRVGTVQRWRKDPTGRQWFRSAPPETATTTAGEKFARMIRGVSPPPPDEIQAFDAPHENDDESTVDWEAFDAAFDAKKVWLDRQENFPIDSEGDE